MFLQGFSIEYSFLAIVISIAVAFWIYHDAKELGIEPVGYVVLTCLCSFFCGGVVYLIARSNHENVQRRNPYYGEPGSNSPYQPPSYIPPSNQQSPYREPSDQNESRLGNSYSGNQTYIDPSSHPDEKFCSSCGNPILPGAKFCSTCGQSL